MSRSCRAILIAAVAVLQLGEDELSVITRLELELGNARRTDALRHLQHRYGAQYRPHRLNATAQHLLQFSLILLRDLNTQRGAGHT